MENQNPIFIVGCGHSGTSIMLTMLGSHSSLYAIPYESRIFYDQYVCKIIFTMLSWQKKCLSNGKKRWVEKTPGHIFKLKDIFQYFPKSKVIVMVRDGRDVACSLKQRNGSFEEGVSEWLQAIFALEKYCNDPRIILVKLEDLVSNPHTVLKNLFNFLEEEYDNSILDYYKKPKYYYSNQIIKPQEEKDGENHLQLRNWQINQALFESTTRWKSEINDIEKEYFKKKAQKFLIKYGYVENNNW